ncbi:MAG: hypothetical protein IJ058_14525 [Lachnospiraceae bacterium]|nr:hypothetical protein [Lachnospiraceae bacterium]MBQ8947997.1 hypothetical protein [Lachnospiraceae bacterium]
MSIKSKIKNDLYQINYIIPFTLKYLQNGKVNYVKKALPYFMKLRVVKGTGNRDLSKDIIKLMQEIRMNPVKGSSFFYTLDEYKTVAAKGSFIGNCAIDFDMIINHAFIDYAEKAIAVGGIYGERAKNTIYGLQVLIDRSIIAIENSTQSLDKERLIWEFKRILNNPAIHFHEALQRVLFFNQYLWQTRHRLNGLGLLDRVLDKTYHHDIREGIITKEDAYEMIIDFLKCLCEWYEFKSSSLMGDIGQIIILGGLESKDKYFCNDLTYLFLKAQAELKRPDPKTLLRVSSQMPRDLLKAAVAALMSSTGSPLLSNDDVIIPVLSKGIFLKSDVYNYGVSACWEPFIPGKCLDQNNVLKFDFFEVLEKVLSQNELSEVSEYDELINLYDKQLKDSWEDALDSLNEQKWSVDPFFSILTEGCTESGKDISEGGAKYNNYGVTTVGIASTVDSLLNIKKYVFEDKEYKLNEINGFRLKNYNTNKKLLQRLKTSKCFAHDSNSSIELTNHIIIKSNEVVDKHINSLGGMVKYGLSSPDYVRNGKKTGADFAGRLSGQPYETHISAYDVSYTELVSFAGNIQYDSPCVNGNVIDLIVPPSFILTNKEKFIEFIRSSIKLGFYQMQMNVLDSKTLKEAKMHPERYKGLIVRVWGFSAYFVELPEDYQDQIIKRAEKIYE